MQLIRALALLILVIMAIPASPKDMPIGNIEQHITSTNICLNLKNGDTVTLRSAGGSVPEAAKIIECIRNKDVIVRLDVAVSAATFIVLGAKKICTTHIGMVKVHSPHYVTPKGRVELGINELRQYFTTLGVLMSSWGYKQKDIYFIIGVNIMTPSTVLTTIPKETYIDLLGDRYIGECND